MFNYCSNMKQQSTSRFSRKMWHSPILLSSSNSDPKSLIRRFLGIRGSRTFFITSGQCSSLLARSWWTHSKTNFRTPSSLQEMLRFSEETSFFMRPAGKERKPGETKISITSHYFISSCHWWKSTQTVHVVKLLINNNFTGY